MTVTPESSTSEITHGEPVSRWWVPGSLLFALAATAPLLLNPGFLNTRGGGDSPFLLFRLHQLYTALSDGIFPVRWMPDAAFGLGYPFFSYYAALPFYFAAGLRALGLSYVLSLKLTHLAGFLVAAWGMFAWVRRTTGSRSAALLASAAYTFAPYHLVNVYVRGDSLVEFWAMAWYPPILLALYEAARRPTARRIVPVALSYGALVMTHNVSALIFSPFVVVYGAGCALTLHPFPGPPRTGEGKKADRDPFLRERARRIGLLAAGGALGLVLAMWVWLPALGEQGYAQLGEQTTGYFFYGNHFRARALVQPGFFFDYDTGSETATPFSMGLAQATLAGLGVAALVTRMIRRKAWWRDGFVLFGLALSTLMITPLSEPVWASVPLLPFAQFPWRFLSVQALFGAAVIGALVPARDSAHPVTVEHLGANQAAAPDRRLGNPLRVFPSPLSRRDLRSPRDVPSPAERGESAHPARARSARRGEGSGSNRLRWASFLPVLASGLGILLAAAALGNLKPNFIPLNDADVTPQRLRWYESFSGNIGTTIRHEYLPVWTQPRPYTSDILLGCEPRAKFLQGEGTAKRIEARAAGQVWAFEVEGESARVALPLLYWPGWKAEIVETRQTVPLQPLEGLGYALLDVPGGEHTIRLRLGRTPLRLGAEAASLAALVIVAVLWHPRLPRWDRTGWALAAGAVVSVVVTALVLHSIPVHELAGPLNADFAQEAYFHHNPAGVLYDDGVRLLSNTHVIEDRALKPYQTWSAPVLPYEYFVALTAPPPQLERGGPSFPDYLALPPSSLAGNVPLSAPTPGLYFVRIIRPDAVPVTANGHPRDRRLFGTPVLIPPDYPVDVAGKYAGEDAGEYAADADFGLAKLTSARVFDASFEQLYVTLFWDVLEEATRNYAIALRLYDVAGSEWAALDTQAGGAGLYPTGLWVPGQIIADNYHLALPPGTPPGTYTLRVTLYDAVSLEPTGTTEVEGVSFRSPTPVSCEGITTLYREIGFTQVEMPPTLSEGDPLSVTVDWTVSRTPAGVYRAAWTLTGQGKPEAPSYTITTALAPGSDPRLWEPPAPHDCAFVQGRHHLELPHDLPPGDYTLTLQLLSEDGQPLGDPHEAGAVRLEGRARAFDVPPLETPLEVRFGDQIRLWGYTLHQEEAALTLDVAWGALADPTTDYKIFVHLFDPANEEIIAQLDTMPRDYTYPTSLWTAGEVVAETLALDLGDVPPGTYWVALGWYDPQVGRLAAITADGSALPDGRVILDKVITVP